MSKMLLISNDNKLTSSIEKTAKNIGCIYLVYANSKDPLDIISEIISINPTLLVLDDDFLSPSSNKILEALKKVNTKFSIIFITSNSEIEFGKSINKIGVQYYLIKPVIDENLEIFIQSVKKQYEKKYYK